MQSDTILFHTTISSSSTPLFFPPPPPPLHHSTTLSNYSYLTPIKGGEPLKKPFKAKKYVVKALQDTRFL